MAGSQNRLSLSTMKLQLTLKSASDIQDADLLSDTKVYAVAWIEGGSRPAKQNTQPKEGYSNPRWNDVEFKWNEVMSLIVEEKELRQDLLRLKLELRTQKIETNGDEKVGDVSIPIKFLADRKRNFGRSYRVRNPSGRFTGKINLTMQLFGPKNGKKRKKVQLTTRTPSTPPTIESPCSTPEAVSPCSSSPYPPFTTPDYLQQAADPNPNLNLNPTFPPSPDYSPSFPASPDYSPSNPCYPHQAASPSTTYSQAAAPLPPSPDYSPSFAPSPVYSPSNSCFPHQAASPYNTTYSQAAAPLSPQVPYPAQYLARVGVYPPQHAITPLLTNLPKHKERKKKIQKKEGKKKGKKKKGKKKHKRKMKETTTQNEEMKKVVYSRSPRLSFPHSPEGVSPGSNCPHSPEGVSPGSNCPHSPEGASPCSSSPYSPFRTPDYLRHASYTNLNPNPNPTFPPSPDYSPSNPCYPYQAAASLLPQVPYSAQYLGRVGEYPPQQALTQKKKRKMEKAERKKKNREMKEWKKKTWTQQQKQVPLNFCTEVSIPYPHFSLQVQYPSSQHCPPSSGYLHPAFTQFPPPNYPQHADFPSSHHYPPSSGYPHPPFPQFTRPFHPQQAAHLNHNSNSNFTFPQPNYPQQAAHLNHNSNPNFTFPQQAEYPNPNPTFPRPDYPQQAAYPNPNFNPNPTFPPPDYCQQTANTNPNPTFSPYAGYATQHLAPGEQYPLQHAYPQQGGHSAYSGCPYDQGGNIPYTIVPPAQ